MIVMMILVVILMFVMLVLTWVMLTLVHVFFIRHTLEVSLELTVTLTFRQRTHLHVDVTTCHLRLLVGMTHGGQIGFDLGRQLVAEFLVCHLTTTELKLNADLVTFGEEVFCMDDLDQVIVRIDADTELQFLQLATLLVLVGLLLVLFLDILVFAVIHDFADRWLCIGCNFDKVKTTFFGHAQRLLSGQHAILLVRDAIDDADFRRTDTLVDSGLVGITAVVTLGSTSPTATWAIEGRSAATTGARLISPRGCWTTDRRAGGGPGSRCSCRWLRRSGVLIWTTAGEIACAQIIEWIANG